MQSIWKQALAITAVGALLLAGCAKGDATPHDAPVEEPEIQQEPGPLDGPKMREAGPGEIEEEPVTILVAAAASLEYSYKDKLIPMFQAQYPHIRVEGTYDSSGKLQTQMEEGLEADVFMSAAMKQMNALRDGSLIDAGTVVELLENRIVLIAPADTDTEIDSFARITDAAAIALGNPESVPAGQYAQEALTSLGVYNAIQPKVSLGANVTEVLNWVAEGSADVGIVYATDAATTDKVKIVAEAPEGSLEQKVIYPVGVVANSANAQAAQLFVDFLASAEALQVFADYGFTPHI